MSNIITDNGAEYRRAVSRDPYSRSRDDLAARIEYLEEENRQLRAALTTSSPLPKALGLTVMQSELISCLMRFAPRAVSYDTIMLALYNEKRDQPTNNVTNVMVCKMRKKLQPHGVQIETHWGFGFSVSDASAKRLRELAQ